MLKVSRTLDSHLKSVSNTMREILGAAGQYNLHLAENARFKLEAVLPSKDVDDALLNSAAALFGIDKDILELLFYDYTQNEFKEKTQLEKVIKAGLASKLAELLISKKVISGPQSSAKEAANNLGVILSSNEEFNTASLQAAFTAYAGLLDHAAKLAEHFEQHGINSKGTLDINRLIELFSERNDSEYEKLKIVCKELLKASNLLFEDEEFRDSVVISLLVLYFTARHNTHSSESCHEAGRHEVSLKILYQYVREYEATKNKPGSVVQLKQVIDKVANTPSFEFRHMELFKDGLATGYLPTSINAMLSARFDSIETEFREKREKVEKMLADFKKEVRNFLDIQLSEEIITQSLDSGLITAYMITSAGKGGLMEVFDDYLDKAAGHLADADPENYKGILLNKKGPVAGKNTRIGIVPLGLTFEEFDSRFHDIMSLAVHNYNQIHGDDRQGYSYNLVKINASESAFRHRVPGLAEVDPKSETHPINIIRSLMLDHLSPVKNLEIIASVKSDLPKTIAMRWWTAKVLDSQASILLLTFERIGRMVSGSVLLDKMKSKDFDQLLFARYSARTLTEFARQVQGMILSKGEDKALDKLTKDVSTIVKSFGARMGNEDIAILSRAILDKAKNIDQIIMMQ